jgi:hypothetical protein
MDFYWNMPLNQTEEHEPFTLIDEDVLCEAQREQLGFFAESVHACYVAAFEFSARFFLYDPNDGECFIAWTNSAECEEGLVPSSYYDFYEINDTIENTHEDESSETEIEQNNSWSVRLVAESKFCDSEGVSMGNFFPVEECG